MDRIFISYARADAEPVDALVAALARESVSGWRDDTDLAAGAPVSEELRRRLRAAGAIVVAVSPKSIESEWVLFEIGAAQSMGKPIIPVIVGGDAWDPQSTVLRAYQWIDGRNRPSYEVGREVLNAVEAARRRPPVQ